MMEEQDKEKFWEDMGRPAESEVVKLHAAYVVAINTDGSLSTTLVKPGSAISFEVERATNTYDVFSTSKEIATEIESQLMADRIAKTVLSQIMPKDPEADAKARIAQALADRKAE